MVEREQSERDSFDELLDTLKLNMKAVSALSQNNAEFRRRAMNSLTTSKDLDVQNLLTLISRRFRKSSIWSLVVAISEIALSSILLFFSLGLIVPAFFSYDNPDEILNYFTSKITVSHPTVVTSSLISTLLFAMAISMLLGAFGILKMAANTLEDSGITM